MRTIYEDAGVSGARTRRPALDKAMRALQAGDTLVVWRLDRLGRSIQHLVSIIHEFGEKRIGFQSLSESIGTTTPSGELYFHLMSAMAQFERAAYCRAMQGRYGSGAQARHAHRSSRGRIFLAPATLHECEKISDRNYGPSREALEPE